jgi:hypothetical protein
LVWGTQVLKQVKANRLLQTLTVVNGAVFFLEIWITEVYLIINCSNVDNLYAIEQSYRDAQNARLYGLRKQGGQRVQSYNKTSKSYLIINCSNVDNLYAIEQS